MGFYIPSNESIDENHEAVSNEAPVAGLDSRLHDLIRSASIVALVEDYCRCRLMHDVPFDQVVSDAKCLCDSALDNGDMTSSDFDHVMAWLEAHHFDSPKEKLMEKFVKHVCGEEIAELLQDKEESCEMCEDFRKAAEIKRQCEQMGNDMYAKYGDIVIGCVTDFIRLYGKCFDEEFRAKLGI